MTAATSAWSHVASIRVASQPFNDRLGKRTKGVLTPLAPPWSKRSELSAQNVIGRQRSSPDVTLQPSVVLSGRAGQLTNSKIQQQEQDLVTVALGTPGVSSMRLIGVSEALLCLLSSLAVSAHLCRLTGSSPIELLLAHGPPINDRTNYNGVVVTDSYTLSRDVFRYPSLFRKASRLAGPWSAAMALALESGRHMGPGRIRYLPFSPFSFIARTLREVLLPVTREPRAFFSLQRSIELAPLELLNV
ncbi:hypothetical protein PM082_015296 [Marasmius tenuissimus]|nr:hypothetical protein PM082_015296 [Marasmius tenuissimus]